MNKKLLAMAVGAALVAGTTAATAGEPTFYGKIHVSVDSLDNGATDGDSIYVSSNSSRLGIKGDVDLDGGLKAVYKYEMSTPYDESGLAGDRNAYLGLKGGFGQVIAGRHDMPFKTVGRKHDLFGDTIGDHRQITRARIGGDDWADRNGSVLMYTNKFGAVDFKLAYAPEDDNGDDSEDLGIGLGYKQGPLGLMFAHETHGNGGGAAEDSTGMILAGTYGMGNITLAAGYGTISDIGGTADVDGTVMTLGAAMKSGANTFKLQYTTLEQDVVGTKDDATLMALGVDHKLGKKTKVYAVYAVVGNDTNTSYGFTGGGHGAGLAGATNEDSSGFSLGMIHKF